MFMNTFSEPSDLLLEDDIISQEEKDEILASIEQDFLRADDDIGELTKISSLSSGLRLPITVGVISVIFTLILLFIADRILFQDDLNPVSSKLTIYSGSEWEVLKIYMKDSKRILDTKNIEIDIYREEIVNYDMKLGSLRELLKIKEKAEKKLYQEREKLVKQGVREEEISARVDSLEQSIISKLAPDVVYLYKSSIVEINGKIEQILNDKSFSEKNLEESIAEKTVLVNENEVIKKEIESRQKETTVSLDIITAMNKIDEIKVQSENEDYIRKQITALYIEFFDNLDNELYDSANEKISKLQDFLRDSMMIPDSRLINQLKMHEKVTNILYKFIELQGKAPEETIAEQSPAALKLEEINKAADTAEKNINLGNIELAGNQLQEALSKVPEILRAINLLKEIDEKNNHEFKIAEDKTDIVENIDNAITESKAEKITPEGNVDITQMILLGKIGDIQFDQITIVPLSTFEPELGTKFYILKQDDQDDELILGSGVIRAVFEGGITGKLESLFIFSSKPEINDLIYINTDLNL